MRGCTCEHGLFKAELWPPHVSHAMQRMVTYTIVQTAYTSSKPKHLQARFHLQAHASAAPAKRGSWLGFVVAAAWLAFLLSGRAACLGAPCKAVQGSMLPPGSASRGLERMWLWKRCRMAGEAGQPKALTCRMAM